MTDADLVPFEHDPELDLVLERTIGVPTPLVWQAWTEPVHVKKWFAPLPWVVIDCAIDLRPGGRFRTVMQGPDGTTMPGDGCYLHIVEQRLLVFTDALLPGYRPAPEPFFTAAISFTPEGNGTRYVARAIHGTRDDKARHEEMGFQQGWGTALDQLVVAMSGR